MIDALLAHLGDGPVPAICATLLIALVLVLRELRRGRRARLSPPPPSPEGRPSRPLQPAPVSVRMARNILVVEDEEHVARVTARLLRAAFPHVEVELVHDADTALDLARAIRVDLFIVDLGLPGMQGGELIRQIRSASVNPVAAVIVVSGADPEAVEYVARQAGANAWIVKSADGGKALVAEAARLLGVAPEA